ncbi:thiamine phosphate synthase [Amorphus orientalis]|uniref:Thiamine-phosphate synthase n=1 Tax=Amorphus orientalis TaxID=649198 RepID=A0AAE4ATF9_9HYPH|nr:thiamine phosphate synthase [Amorphus orientalis]MDQ0316122.1 thiamine-phosphate pyrophosphorylase [Amorphus orientalis]
MPVPFDLTLYFVTDHRQPIEQTVDITRAAVAGGVTMVQLRKPEAHGRQLLEEALALKAVLAGTGVPLIVNDRIDVAHAAGADGVHVGQSDLPAAAARAILGPDAIIGLSSVTPEEMAAIDPAAVDYVGIGPFAATTTKGDAGDALAIEGTRHACRLSPVRMVAIGGITETNAADVATTGVEGISVVSALSEASDPRAAAHRLRAAFETGRG